MIPTLELGTHRSYSLFKLSVVSRSFRIVSSELILAEQDSGPGWGCRLRPARIDFNTRVTLHHRAGLLRQFDAADPLLSHPRTLLRATALGRLDAQVRAIPLGSVLRRGGVVIYSCRRRDTEWRAVPLNDSLV